MLKPNKFDTMSWSYDLVKKNDEVFTPLRATGLAVELAHKLAKEKGTGNVCSEGLAFFGFVPLFVSSSCCVLTSSTVCGGSVV